jgi:hypothetical protein
MLIYISPYLESTNVFPLFLAHSERMRVHDAGGPSVPQLHEFISNLTKSHADKIDQGGSHLVYIVSPEPLSAMTMGAKGCEVYELEKEVWPHFSSEHFSTYKDLTLRVYKHLQNCE